MSATVSSNAFSDFPATFKGPVHRPGDAAYDEVRQLWNARFSDRIPALIARATDVDDVVVAVGYATRRDVSIAVRAGGHSIEGFAMPHDALVVDLSLMNDVGFDPATGVVTAQAGALLGDVYAATEEHDRFVSGGSDSTVGLAGLTLGGGIGHLTRRFGATVDSLLSVEVVTMGGRVLTASPDQNQELFWGMKGAGPNLAIVTSLTLATHRLESVICRDMMFGPGDALAVLAGLDDVLARSPLGLSITPIVRKAPPDPGRPDPDAGQAVVLARLVYTGPREEYESAMRAARSLPAPAFEMDGPPTWLAIHEPIDLAGRREHNGGAYLAGVSQEIAEIALESVAAAPPDCRVNFPLLGGALHDAAEDSAAFSRAGAQRMYQITAQWDSPAADDEYISWVEATAEKLAPHTLRNGYVNLNPGATPEELQVIYGSAEKWERLLRLKRTWDPDNRLCHNKNIRPVA